MKFYIVDDDINVIRILSNVIEKNNSFEIIGSATNGEKAFKEILVMKPNIVLVDLLMPIMDGNTLVKELKSINPQLSFIMISQVLDSQLRSESYESGIEFFITKPINIIEVERVVSTVAEKIELDNTLSNIKKIFQSTGKQSRCKNEHYTIKIKNILGILGMLGEKGTNDIIKITLYLLENDISFIDYDFVSLENRLGDSTRIVKQRVRRAIKNGLTNIANLGVNDYSNDVFHVYANILFDFSSVKAEMDWITGKKNKRGKISLNKFFEGLIHICQTE
ncbi:two-component system response regulator YcbB [Sedimentibacter acidaminivorans]|uniref:Two-component system response regulator YcbB n=1 Tax=Sedimentibacter acidaminivorans TaxID=913099 RepID=A0ABS4GIQ2_9FIRM|nr:DNA-binding domain-containing protein [Sedimentibacter acidaminivorans]MBP1927240.1 two-component system response regulator YcbB [Sedimentibacter acidaminivorans]